MGGYGNTQAQVQAQIKARQKAQQDAHNEGVKDHAADAAAYKELNKEFPLTTNFGDLDMDTMKAMVASVDPNGVEQVGHHWNHVHNQLVGAGGDGSGDCVYGSLKRAVDGVMEHWEGESANNFRLQANDILTQISNTASHAKTASVAVIQTAGDIRTQRDALSKIKKPSWFASAWDSLTDSGRTDKYTEEEVRNKTLPKDVIAQIDENNLSAGKEAQLNAAAVMENLARSYVGCTQHIKSSWIDEHPKGVPPSNPTIPMPTPIPPFTGSSATPSASSPSLKAKHFGTLPSPNEVTGPRHSGISGGQQIPVSQTEIDGLPGGIKGNPPETIPGGKLPIGEPGPGGPGMKSPIGLGGYPGGIPDGNPGGTGGGRFSGGRTGGVRGGIGSSAAEEGQGGRGGMRGGMRGMHGMGGGGAKDGMGAKGGGRGPLARAKGGVAGAPKGITGKKGPATPGGTGLGKGRGSGASAAGGRGGRGMLAGGMRGANQRPGEEENEEGTRPDYLVEDEETWTPEDYRSVPKNIE